MGTADPWVKWYARKVRAARAILDESQEEFATRVGGVTKRTVRAWEKEKHLPQAQHRIRLHEIFDEIAAEEAKERKVVGL